MVLNMNMDVFFSEENIVILQRLMSAGITASARMALFGMLNKQFIDAQDLAKQEEQRRIARENDFA